MVAHPTAAFLEQLASLLLNCPNLNVKQAVVVGHEVHFRHWRRLHGADIQRVHREALEGQLLGRGDEDPKAEECVRRGGQREEKKKTPVLQWVGCDHRAPMKTIPGFTGRRLHRQCSWSEYSGCCCRGPRRTDLLLLSTRATQRTDRASCQAAQHRRINSPAGASRVRFEGRPATSRAHCGVCVLEGKQQHSSSEIRLGHQRLSIIRSSG